jgi:16S rRNA (cytidine1402-2'-O)-methyltransferase
VVGPPRGDEGVMTQHDLDDLLRASLARDSVKDSVAYAVELSGRPRREVYARALELAREIRGDDGED